MGFSDNFSSMNAAMMAAFGSDITYHPSDSMIGAFAGRAEFGLEPEIIDELQRNVVADRCRCRIQHSMLTSAGVISPTPARERQAGDTITRKDFNGSDQIWTVVDIEPEEGGTWILTLERNLRIVP